MSISEQQGKGPLTRKQLRELRLIGSTPVITEEAAPDPGRSDEVPAVSEAAAESGAAPLTRRQAREQERLRTGAVPVAEEPAELEDAAEASVQEPDTSAVTEPAVAEPVVPEPVVEPVVPEPAVADASAGGDITDLGVDPAAALGSDKDRPLVSPSFGSSFLQEEAGSAALAPSFDELITTNDSAGSQHTAPSSLIFTPPPGEGSLSGPVASTGEVLVTGSYELPDGLGSQGHARGTTDGKDVDVVLIDGELPAASSPTPIAASSAISTIKPAGEVIRPPAPEKGNRLMLILAITAGGLALVLAGALVFAFTTNLL